MPLFTPALLLVAAFPAQADDSRESGVLESSAEQRLVHAKQAAARYRFRLAGRSDVPVGLHGEPLLRWNNHVVREDDAMLFLWTEREKGRPVAAAQFFLQGADWHHEFQSLSPAGFDARFEGETAGQWTWRPDRPGVKFEPAADVDAPANTAASRLRQMRGIAERFNAAVDSEQTGFTSPHELRLLTTPVYRYSSDDDGIVDGAVFVFAQGTNPEVMLIVEARKSGGTDPVWQFGFAPMTSFALRVRRKETSVFQWERQTVPTPDPSMSYHFRFRAQPDRSAEVKLPASAKQE